MQRKLRLRAVFFQADFRFGDRGLWEWAQRQKHWPGTLGDGDTCLLVSCRGDQLMWLYGHWELANGKTVLDSQRWRIPTGGTWDPAMLGEYAAMSGIDLGSGIRDFRASYEAARQHKRALRQEHKHGTEVQ